MAYRLHYSDYPGSAGPPDPAAWVGPPGPQGVPGPVGPQGIPGPDAGGLYYLPLSGGTVSGDVHVTTNIDADTGLFAGIAYPNQRLGFSGGVEYRTWVGLSDNGYMTYYDTQSLVAFIPPPAYAIGVASSVRSSDRLFGPKSANIAIAAFGTSDSTDANAGPTWAYYGTSRRILSGRTTYGMELSSGNLASTSNPYNPYANALGGYSFGIWMSSGSEAYGSGLSVYPSTAAYVVASNGSTWNAGLVFNDGALTPGAGGITKAIQLPAKAEIQWTFDTTGARSAFIRSDATAANPGVVFKSGSFNVTDNAETVNLLQVSAAGASVTGGLHLAGIVGASNADVTKHIELYTGAGYGFGVTAGSLNYVVPAAGIHTFVVNAVTVGTLTSTGMNFCAIGAAGASTGTFTALVGNTVATGGPTGPTWTSGGSAPAATAPIGSLYSRVGGAVGATLYVSRGGGTWVAVAGV